MVAFSCREKYPLASSWTLCIIEAASVLVLLTATFDPYYLFCFIVPILFAIILLELKQSATFIGLMMAATIALFFLHFHDWTFSGKIAVPIILLTSISILLELILSQIHENLTWYHKRYQTALNNEQIIRENEIKLEKLVNSLKDYENYLSTTNISLIQARNEAEEARTVKQNFVQNVSHELRTPLNLIIGFSETMINSPQSYGEVNWTPDLRGDIECIYQNSQHLKNLIDDILDMASLENKKYEIEVSNVNLNSIIHEVVLITESAYRAKGLYLETDLSPLVKNVHADTVRLKQVILNLLSNALKYTSKGGVKISSTIMESMACVFAKDTGKGIPGEDLDKVFDAFFQVDKSNNREDYGTGLGLSISKQLIELHGGEMSISSELGKGTTVYFSVPLSKK
jgi:signal transduction histidine kinase